MASSKPTFQDEKKFWEAGQNHVAGTDEVGRGSWAGPIVAAAVILPTDFLPRVVRDSKTLSPGQREKMFVYITRQAVAWAVGVVPPAEIDRIGIAQANTAAMLQAIRKLQPQPDAILVDAVRLTYKQKPVKSIIRADATSLTVAAASIVAKVVRDTLMRGEHRQHPQYGFSEHKGYGTKAHETALKKHGISSIHRRSFQPMKSLVS